VSLVIPIVLAAGASSRMGRPKALLDFDGHSCLELVLAACQGEELGLGRPIVVTAPDGESVRAHLRAVGTTVTEAVNPRPELGQLSSLQAGLRLLPTGSDGFLIFPMDHPLVRADDVGPLVAAFTARRPGQRLFVPSFAKRRGHPVLLDASLAPELLALLSEGSARALFSAHEHELVYVEAVSDRVLVDMDTPDDYQRCLDRYRTERRAGLPPR